MDLLKSTGCPKFPHDLTVTPTWLLGQLHRDEEQERLERQYEHSHWEDIRSSATGEELLNMVNIIKLQVSA